MNRTIVCPHCRVLNRVPGESCAPPQGAVCTYCGRRLPAGAPAATVLCIDDDPLVLHFYRDFLEPRGFRTLTIADGLAGFACAQQEHPDVILLDVMLRSLSGFDICGKLRADPALQDTPIIILTVWDDPSVSRTGRAAGATLTLRKPADAEMIVSAIEHVLSRPPDPRPS